jgi:glycosyltransferase involved in cell wall biosynthesis
MAAENNSIKLSVIMPVYNEVNTVRDIIARVLSVPAVDELVIVDDFSTDGTTEVLKQLKDTRIKVLFHRRNRGKGAAVRTGLKNLTGDAAVIQDADLEYDPRDYTKLLEPITAGEAAVVFGSRFRGAHSGFHPLYKLGNKFLTITANILYGARLTDMETCYKMFKTSVLEGIELKADRFDIEPEITAKLIKRGAEIKEVPVSYRSRGFREGKKITWRDGFAAVWTLVKYRFKD